MEEIIKQNEEEIKAQVARSLAQTTIIAVQIDTLEKQRAFHKAIVNKFMEQEFKKHGEGSEFKCIICGDTDCEPICAGCQ